MISFVETMRGAVRGPDGGEHPISFTVRAEREAGGRFRLDGVVAAPPWAPEGPAQGTLILRVAPPAILYSLQFGGGLSVEARKDPRPAAPLESLTWMPVTLRAASGDVLATGSMRFALRELPRFLASWLPFARAQQRQLDARRRSLLRAGWGEPGR